MTILAEIFDKVKRNDEDQFRVRIEAQEAESRKFINCQGFDTMQDIIERKLAAEQMTFKIDEDTGSPLMSVEGKVSTPAISTVAPDSDSDVYKKFLDQLK
jgi:hypothetical protein